MLSNLELVSEANLGKGNYTELHKLIYDVQTLVNRTEIYLAEKLYNELHKYYTRLSGIRAIFVNNTQNCILCIS